MNHPGQYCDPELNAIFLLKLGSRSDAAELTKKGTRTFQSQMYHKDHRANISACYADNFSSE